jgi:hypothetical protein
VLTDAPTAFASLPTERPFPKREFQFLKSNLMELPNEVANFNLVHDGLDGFATKTRRPVSIAHQTF